MKNLTTQMASWTQSRANTILYANRSYTGNLLYSYPRGFVEPQVEFSEGMRAVALRTGQLLGALSVRGQLSRVLHERAGKTRF